MRLDDNQVEFIEEQLNKSKVDSKELKDDLLDHMCCLVEINMKKGLSFEQAYHKAFLQTSPNGFEEVQNETLFLLNYNKIIIMKQLTYITGFIFTFTFVFGAFFKYLHLPGATIMLYGGLTGGACIFVPLLLVNQFKGQIALVLTEKLKWIFGSATIVLVALGAWLKLIHLPGANIILGITLLVFGFGFLPFFFFRMYKKSIEQV